jgi:hypothetical protein
MTLFDDLISKSYTHPLSDEIKTACVNQGTTLDSTETVASATSSSSTQCTSTSICVIPAGSTFTMDSNFNVGALIVRGTLNWMVHARTHMHAHAHTHVLVGRLNWKARACAHTYTHTHTHTHITLTQGQDVSDATVHLCAGYVAVDGGTLDIDYDLAGKTAIIYIKNNGATDPTIRTRAFGGYNDATLSVVGREMTRTWSL